MIGERDPQQNGWYSIDKPYFAINTVSYAYLYELSCRTLVEHRILIKL